MEKKVYHKLIRDKIPQIIEASGGQCRVEVLKDADYLANEKNLADFTEYYLLNSFYGMLAEESARIALTATKTEQALSFDAVKMPE